jgi:hypothetical protein
VRTEKPNPLARGRARRRSRGPGGRAALALAALAAACGGAATGPPQPSVEYESGRRAAVTADGLYRVKSWRLPNVYLKPEALFTTYRAIVIDPVSVSYERTPRHRRDFGGGPGNYALEPWEMERFRALFQKSLETELAKSSYFDIVQEPAPEALRVTPLIVDLVVNVPPESGRDLVYVSVAGELTVILNVADSQTGESLARLAERRKVLPATFLVSEVGSYEWVETENLFRNWARLLREGLEELATLGPIPAPPPEVGAPGATPDGAAESRPGRRSPE